MVDVSEVKTDGRVPDARLAWPRVAYLSFLITKFLGAAIPVNANGIDAAHAIFLDDLTERARDHPSGSDSKIHIPAPHALMQMLESKVHQHDCSQAWTGCFA
jgi:hypothetical protein